MASLEVMKSLFFPLSPYWLGPFSTTHYSSFDLVKDSMKVKFMVKDTMASNP